MEEFSGAYLRALAVEADFLAVKPDIDEDSEDFEIRAKGEFGGRRSPRFCVQLKCTYEFQPKSGTLSYRLKKKNYEQLRLPNRTIPIFLFVIVVPPNRSGDWIRWTEQEMLLRGQAFWTSLRGAAPSTVQGDKVTVHLSSMLSPQALQEIMMSVARES